MSETLREGVEALVEHHWINLANSTDRFLATNYGLVVLVDDLKDVLAATAPTPDEVGQVEGLAAKHTANVAAAEEQRDQALAVQVCLASDWHTTGQRRAYHAADKYGPCEQCAHYAELFEPILAARTGEAAKRIERELVCACVEGYGDEDFLKGFHHWGCWNAHLAARIVCGQVSVADGVS